MNTGKVNQAVYRTAMSGSQEKLASLAIDLGTFVRDKLREVSIIDKVVPPNYVTHADVQRETGTSTYSMIVDKEVDSKAAVVNLSGGKAATYVKGTRVRIPFTKVETGEYQINVTELPAFTYPVTKVIEDNQVRDVQIAKDHNAFSAVHAALTARGSGVGYKLETVGIGKSVLTNLKNLIDSQKLVTDRIIMNIQTFNEMMALDHTDLGNDLASQVFVDGYVFTTIMGMKLIVTTNSDIIPKNIIYAFAAPDFLGKQFVLQDTQFSIEKRHDLLSWKMWQVLGIGFVNVKSMAALCLNSASMASLKPS
jgi:hypothetical protein